MSVREALLFVRDAILMAVPFDPDTRSIGGEPVSLIDGISEAAGSATGAAQFTFDRKGQLAFVPGGASAGATGELVWVDRQGSATAFSERREAFTGVALAPKGGFAAAMIQPFGSLSNIWTLDLERDILSQLTFDGGIQPLWDPDGESVVYEGLNERAARLYRQYPQRGGTAPEVVFEGDAPRPKSFTPDGETLVIADWKENGRYGLWILPPDGGEPVPFLPGPELPTTREAQAWTWWTAP